MNDVGLIFAASTVGGALTATATTGHITQGSGNLTITGAATFITVEAESNIILDGSGNAFAAAVTMRAGNGSNAVSYTHLTLPTNREV